MKRYAFAIVAMMMCLPLWAQKNTSVDFSEEDFPAQLLAYANGSTSDRDKQKENRQVVEAFGASYGALDPAMQRRVVALYTYAVRAKMKGNPELMNLTRTLTAYATAPQGAGNLEGWMQAMETYSRRNAKAKVALDFVGFSDGLLAERVLYRSATSEWSFDIHTPFRLGVEEGAIRVWFDTPADLHYASAKDWNVIHGTTGVLDYKEGTWRGHGGRLDWARTGLGAEACYADLRGYKAEVKFPKFTADSVQFVNTHYFSQPIVGRVEEAMQGSMEPEKYTYPRFRSYQRDFVIRDIMPDVDYNGSFMMNGSKFITASSKHPARLVFRRQGSPRLTVTSLKFTITPERLLAENAQVAFLLGPDDSISNTGITVRYLPAERKVTLVNDQQRNFYSPYIDTWHQLDIYSESIVWLVDKDRLEFSSLASAGAVGTATFESANYYTYRKYRDIQGIDEISPVRRALDFAQSRSYSFSAKSFSNYLGLDMSQTLLMIHNLCRHGLVTYNEMTGRVTVKDKLEDYVKAFGHVKGFDYDALTLESTARGVNARMSLADNVLDIRGVEQLVVSDSHQVVVHPDSASGYMVHVGKNRSLRFSGKVECGKFILQVTGCDYSYEQHAFEMPTIDKLEFYVPDFTNPDYEQLVRTPLSGLTGSLRVDLPDNHCGLVKNKEFPLFESRENSYVYYDRRAIQEGQYRRESFYYTLHPFTIGSLADFVTDSLQFNGVLTSAGIFPDIVEPLRVQRDYYLGFNISTPAEGLPAYGGRGTYSDNLRLDAGGLHGAGRMEYLAASLASTHFLFLPDSALAQTDTLTVREEGGFPDIRGGRTSMHWLPYLDSMDIATYSKGRPLAMYRDDAQLRGHVALMPRGASAAGTATVKEGTLVSRRFDLQPRVMDATVSDFTLRSTTFNNVAFEAHRVQSHVDYDARRAELTVPGGPQRTDLPLMQYEAWADRFSWDMDGKVLDIANSARGTSEGLDGLDLRMRLPKVDDMPGARFVSTDARRKGLAFHALLSTYRYNAADLSHSGVYLLAVADAAIAPAADTLHIDKGGAMRPLEGASLLCNRTDAFHLVSNAYILVESAESYTGKGYVEYAAADDQVQRIYLSDLGVDATGRTVGHGTINEAASFVLNPAFGFAGKVRLEGDRELLHFEGGVRLMQTCIPREQMGLLAYAGYTSPDQVQVSVPEVPADWRGKPIAASILLDKTTLQPRAAFLTNERAADNELLSAHGVLTCLGGGQRYIIGSEAKVADPEAVVEPYMAMDTRDCALEGEGPINFALRRTLASFYAYGSARVGISDSRDDHLTTLFGFSFPLGKEVVATMRDALRDDLRLAPTAPGSNAEMRHALMHHLGDERGAAAYAAYSSEGALAQVPEAMRSMLLFDHVRWQYLPGFGWWTDGKVGLVASDDKPLGLQVRLKAQITKRGNAQQMTFYVEAARDHWYFFRFDLMTQELTIYASAGLFEDAVRALSADQRRVERSGLGTLRYHIGANKTEVPTWLTTFSQMVYGGEDD